MPHRRRIHPADVIFADAFGGCTSQRRIEQRISAVDRLVETVREDHIGRVELERADIGG